MNVIVMNEKQAEQQSYRDFASNKAIISITVPFDELPHFNSANYTIKSVLRLAFDDVEEGENAMTEEDAKKIANFVNLYKDKVDCIWVHCAAGVSRSAGVAAAILKATTGDDSKIFDSNNYCPNMLCYRLTLNALHNNSKGE